MTVVGSLIGNSEASGDQASQQAALQAALNNIAAVNVPSVEEQQVQLALQKSAGALSPEMEGTVSQGNTGLKNINVDPRLRDAQMSALQSLKEQGQTGLTATDRLALNQILNQSAQQSNSANQAVLQNMAAKGMAGSGATLAAQLANNQNSANNAQQRALQVSSQAQQNALNATAQSGQLGSQMEGQQYGEAANTANAQDAINRFNAANSQQIMGQNTYARNSAQQANLSNAQNIANSNVGLQNQQQFYNKGLYQQQFNNNMSKAGAMAGANDNMAGYYGNQAAATRGMWTGIGQGVDKAALSAYGAGMFGGGGAGGTSPMSATSSNNYGAGDYFSGNSPKSSGGYSLFSDGGEIPDSESELKIFKCMKNGGHIDGPELVPGDSPKNDVVPILASGGEIMVPKEIAQQDNEDVIMAFIKGVKSGIKKGK